MTGQLTFDEIDDELPLHRATFVVVDLETTGGSSRQDTVTEIGAVKVRGGEVLGEFGTLVDPGREIPPMVVSITGITQAMVHGAPRFDSVLPAFLEFARDAVLVAHNAPFDVGFLRAECERLGVAWPKPAVLCTAKLARRVLSKDETPNHKLGTLARVLHARTTPVHRALDDARATVDVLHALLERLGPLGVRTVPELLEHLPDVTPQQRRNRGLADPLPHAPGVYLFRGPNEEVLYVGTASDLQRRVRQYFTAGERRARVKEMAGLAQRVDHVECAHPLEAEVRELRLLGAHQPRYNRRSKFPKRTWWVVLTEEAFPRLSIVRTARDGALGPFRSRTAAAAAVEALHAGGSLRRCTERIPARDQRGRPCALHELGRCAAPCAGLQGVEEYAPEVISVREVISGSPRWEPGGLLDRLRAELGRFSAEERFEDAAAARDRLAELVRALDRAQRWAALAAVPELVAARPDGSGGWQLAVVRHGRLAAAGNARRGVPPMPVVDALQAAAETVLPEPGPLRGAPADEVRVVHRWLTTGGTRLVRCAQPWSEPAGSAASWREWLERAAKARAPYPAAD
ncbi:MULTISPECIES: DEDD exonuclease domain-containing protein [unclassified Saccharopolyspora]|uniref:DEDD exonuclease domain-containing protein n=1 Tax=unclassified Saccharopolyspora TaxID=2646250 RepID=UPI001CD2375D|nr:MULTISPECIES: DEDD exonuclease domain-containing protein [unclassified Saccharopolyspora]MCA1187417.1 DEDD exonuclease domain-containing protein [Saccharopolyspora sp. 6T]MCA1192490.1 DEDD exonuclease domain-containing protein [Saccharopolyspora sp. 6V]